MGSQRVRQDLVTEQQMDVNIVCILYGIYILTSGSFSPDQKCLTHVKFLQSITPMIKIEVRSNIS